MTDDHLITALYVRVSTEKQDHASQEGDIQRWADVVGPHEKCVVFRDKYTGTRMDRPGMKAIMALLFERRLRRIVVWRLDRLGRTTSGLCKLFDDLRDFDCDLVSIKDGFNLNSPAGRMHARILASVAEFETEIRAERVKAGQDAARKRGVKLGGSKKGRKTKYSLGPKIPGVLALRRQGLSYRQIKASTGVSLESIRKIFIEHAPELRGNPEDVKCAS